MHFTIKLALFDENDDFQRKVRNADKNHFCHAKDPPEPLIFLGIFMLCSHGAPELHLYAKIHILVEFLENAHFCKMVKIAPGPGPLQTRRQNKAIFRGPGGYFLSKNAIFR